MELETTRDWILFGAAVAAVVALAILLIVVLVRRHSARRRHTEELRDRFGERLRRNGRSTWSEAW